MIASYPPTALDWRTSIELLYSILAPTPRVANPVSLRMAPRLDTLPVSRCRAVIEAHDFGYLFIGWLEDPMEFFEVVFSRYSHKGVLDANLAVPESDLRKMVEAGMAAPSAMNKQSPEFIIVTEPRLLDEIGNLTDNMTLRSAPAIILVLANVEAVGEGYYREDYAAATENILLAGTALGYAVGWVDAVFRNEAVRAQVNSLLGIPGDRVVAVGIPVGKPAEPGQRRPKKPFEMRASWNRYAVVR